MRFGLQPESGSDQDDQPVKLVAPTLPSTSSRYGLFNLSDEEDDYLSEPYEVESDSDVDINPSPLQLRRRAPPTHIGRTKGTSIISSNTARARTTTIKSSSQARTPLKSTLLGHTRTTPARPPPTPLGRTTLSSRYDVLQRSLSKRPPAPATVPRIKPGLVVYDSEESDSDDAPIVPLRDYSTIPNYQPTEPQAFREAKWTAYRDPLEEWERQAKQASLRRAHNSFRLHSSLVEQQRRSRDQEIMRTLEQAQNQEMEEVGRLLSGMRMQQEEEERVLREAHERRKKALWETFEHALELEKAAEARAAAEREAEERAEAAREAEREAEALRMEEEKQRRAAEWVAEERRKKEEKERKAKEKEEEERRLAVEKGKKEEAEKAELEKRSADEAEAVKRREEAQRWDVWTKELRDEAETFAFKGSRMLAAVDRLQAEDKPRDVKKKSTDGRRAMRKSLSTITPELSVLSRIAVEIQKLLFDASVSDIDSYGYLLHHLGVSVVERAEEATEFKELYPLAHVVRLLMTEGGVQRSMGNAVWFALRRETWVVDGVKPPRPDDMSLTDWETQFGKRREDEPSLAYAQRISNYVALYAALCQSDIADDDGRVPPPWTLPDLWKRLVSLLREPQEADWLVPHSVAAILQVAGKRLEEVYGAFQFGKLRQYLEGLCKPDDAENSHWLGREDKGEVGTAGREKLAAILKGWEGDRLAEGREWEDDLERGIYITIESGAGGVGQGRGSAGSDMQF